MADDIWLYVAVTLGAVVVALALLLAMQREKKEQQKKEASLPPKPESSDFRPVSASRSVTDDVVREARDKLRILDLEREILSYAVRRLYEARAEGKISEEERDNLAIKYKDDLNRIKEEISRGESVIALNELERMQEEFVQLFSERFDTLNKRIEDLRNMSGYTMPKTEIPEPEMLIEEEKKEERPVKAGSEKALPTKKRKESSKPKQASESSKPEKSEPEKTEAEKKAEQILAEVEKVLERLGQMEAEG